MKLNPILQKVHDFVTNKMHESEFVENFLIAKVTGSDGNEYDCIYCTIIRNALLFGCIGVLLGFFLGRLS